MPQKNLPNMRALNPCGEERKWNDVKIKREDEC